jgi:DNA-binding transcriptional LysR family regulator
MEWTDRIGRRLKPRDLHVFLAVAEAGTMARAAAELAISRPVVSKTIADLEHTLGVPLLDRTPQGVAPTSYGLALLKRSRAVFDELRQGVKEIEFLVDPNAGELRVGCGDPFMVGLVPAAMQQIMRLHPRVVFRMELGNVTSLPHILRERKCELAIYRKLTDAADPDMEEEVLFHERLLIVAGPRSRWHRARKVALADLADEPWIQAPHEIEPGGPTYEAFRAIGLPVPRVSVFSFSVGLRHALLADGPFVTMIPESALRFGPPHEGLRVLPVEAPAWRKPVILATLKHRATSTLAQLFIERLRALARQFRERKRG